MTSLDGTMNVKGKKGREKFTPRFWLLETYRSHHLATAKKSLEFLDFAEDAHENGEEQESSFHQPTFDCTIDPHYLRSLYRQFYLFDVKRKPQYPPFFYLQICLVKMSLSIFEFSICSPK